jgi:hypothetical protein
MFGHVPFALFVALTAAFAIANRAAPRVAVRLAFAPVRRRVAIPLPPRAAALVTPPKEEGGRYRDLPARGLALAALPGAARIERDDQIVQFDPELGCVLAHPEWSPARLLCVHVSAGLDGLLLRAQRFPATELWFAAFILAAIGRWHSSRFWPLWIAFTFVAASGITIAWRRAGQSFDAVVAEIRARVALANGDPPPPPPPPSPATSRFTGPDEWTCACTKVNERKRSMCRRCWAQRPNG